MRRRILVLIAVAAFMISGCGGGGGGGVPSVTVKGRVIDSQLGALSGINVAISTSTGATLSATTELGGWFEIANVPLGVPLNIKVSGGSIAARTFPGVVLEGAGCGTSADMDLFLTPVSIAPPAGSTVRIAPSVGRVTAGGESYRALVQAPGIATPYYWYASWVIIGDAEGRIDSSDWMVCNVSAVRDGTAKIMAFVYLKDGTLATDVLEVETDMEGIEPPPTPP